MLIYIYLYGYTYKYICQHLYFPIWRCLVVPFGLKQNFFPWHLTAVQKGISVKVRHTDLITYTISLVY